MLTHAWKLTYTCMHMYISAFLNMATQFSSLANLVHHIGWFLLWAEMCTSGIYIHTLQLYYTCIGTCMAVVYGIYWLMHCCIPFICAMSKEWIHSIIVWYDGNYITAASACAQSQCTRHWGTCNHERQPGWLTSMSGREEGGPWKGDKGGEYRAISLFCDKNNT